MPWGEKEDSYWLWKAWGQCEAALRPLAHRRKLKSDDDVFPRGQKHKISISEATFGVFWLIFRPIARSVFSSSQILRIGLF
jgi:hypothetical protein